MRHNLDWRLQTDQRYHLFINHDGPVEGREDRLSIEDLDYGDKTTFISYPERRKAWGAYCRKDWLETIDPEQYEYTLMGCCDDQITPYLVETIHRELADGTGAVFWSLSHHHYNYRAIPGGTFPVLSRVDWISGACRTSLAKEAGINYPDEYAADGHYWQDVFSLLGNDGARIKVLDNFLVVKN